MSHLKAQSILVLIRETNRSDIHFIVHSSEKHLQLSSVRLQPYSRRRLMKKFKPHFFTLHLLILNYIFPILWSTVLQAMLNFLFIIYIEEIS